MTHSSDSAEVILLPPHEVEQLVALSPGALHSADRHYGARFAGRVNKRRQRLLDPVDVLGANALRHGKQLGLTNRAAVTIANCIVGFERAGEQLDRVAQTIGDDGNIYTAPLDSLRLRPGQHATVLDVAELRRKTAEALEQLKARRLAHAE